MATFLVVAVMLLPKQSLLFLLKKIPTQVLLFMVYSSVLMEPERVF
jgi:hypothetical protein